MRTASTAAAILIGVLTGCRVPEAKEETPVPSAMTSAVEVASNSDLSASEPESTTEKVRETKSLEGEFVGFEAGDYLHAVIRLPNGKFRSFYLERGMELFLVDRVKQPLDLVYQVVDSDIPEAGGVIAIDRLHAIEAEKESFADWWKTAEPNFALLIDEAQPRIEKATLAPEDVPPVDDGNP